MSHRHYTQPTFFHSDPVYPLALSRYGGHQSPREALPLAAIRL